ncbi:hypothetical protein T440DRAFT_402824 [Plenodomus tracheiphilus IPT5]|uniref:Uncharacterized protein n=1 Tax=Plenodomus tracheiphilus IPT5 TaxID=1408161 RepID=A0A6A7B024_9PLEO|nr:hypothetical protein T440DRAFT_402824 [Plenodomus tracheiphilus IPT5]
MRPLVSPGTVDLQCMAACPWGLAGGAVGSSVPKAVLRRRRLDWTAWDAWADRSAKAL